MIRKTLYKRKDGRPLFLYENGVAVGAGLTRGDGTNMDRASNQLVQFFLRHFFKVNPTLLPRTGRGGAKFLLDGQVGDQTVTGIRRFQTFARDAGYPLIVDSRVSVTTGASMIPGTKSRWTIHALNEYYENFTGATDFHHLWLNQEIIHEAPELAEELVRKEAR